MNAAFAIAIQTIRASLRSRVFHVLLTLILLAVFVLPITVAGDGTAVGQVQISLTYSLGVVTALISIATLWLSCASLSREIEGYELHLVLTKPVNRFTVLAGKWLGVLAMNGFLFLLAAAIVFSLVLWRIRQGDFSKQEMSRLKNEVLVGRRVYLPEQPDYLSLARKEFERRKQAKKLPEAYSPDVVIAEIMRQIKARASEVPAQYTRRWRFTGVKSPGADKPVYLRYRMYIGTSMSLSEQRETQGVWAVRDPKAPQPDSYAGLPQKVMTGRFHEFPFPGRFVAEDGTVIVTYTNQDLQKSSVMFQMADGPELLIAATGFLANYSRSVFLVILQLAFLAVLGCVVGSLFSTPVAVFVAASYLVIGMTVQSAVQAPFANDLGKYEYHNVAERLAHYLAIGVSKVVVSAGDFDASSIVSRGRLVTGRRILAAIFGLIILRTVPLGALGFWFFSKRELGTVIRR
ncbi:MAG: ABC transporter permease [Kiritimatiellaeota bacterium]|nr:ABC transporter permease [Kiritimatiellota bacterium]